MILANGEAQTRPYQYYVTVSQSLLLSSFERPSRHGSVVCLSECCYGGQPGEGVWNTVYYMEGGYKKGGGL